MTARPRDHWQVHELFTSIQGEGQYAGATALFVRLQGCPVGCHWCLCPSTRIYLASGGRKRIDAIQPGDVLAGYDEETGTLQETVVTATHSHCVEELWSIHGYDENRNTICTRDHMWMTTTGWKRTDELQPGDEILTTAFILNGWRVKSVGPQSVKASMYSGKPKTVYDLTCEPYPTFFANGLLSHNCDAKTTWYRGGTRMNIKAIREAGLPEGTIVPSLLVITGGEPLLYDIDLLLAFAGAKGMRSHLETSGSFPFIGAEIPDWITVSPKAASEWVIVDDVLTYADELKYVCDEDFDPDIPDEHLRQWDQLWDAKSPGKRPRWQPKPKIWLMPEGAPPRSAMVQRALDLCFARGWNFSPRLQYAYPEIAAREGDTNQKRDTAEVREGVKGRARHA